MQHEVESVAVQASQQVVPAWNVSRYQSSQIFTQPG